MKPLIRSLLAGLVLSSAVVVALTFVMVSHQLGQLREQWALKPVMVVTEDVPVGRKLTYDMLSQRSLPARFVTDSMVRPEDASKVVDRPAPVALQVRDTLLWEMFADHTAQDACFQSIIAKVNAAGDSARDGVLSRFEERMVVPQPTPEPVPAPKADASGEVSVVVLTTEVPEGTVLDGSMLAVGKRPGTLTTASFVPAERLHDVIGARAVVALQPKDALMWQMLDDAGQPRRVASCVSEANDAITQARARATREETAAFVRGLEAR